ncbi:MAG: RpiB/LacA/LacB family sugar-phosphate isomerase [Acidimicrobiales bacterium]
MSNRPTVAFAADDTNETTDAVVDHLAGATELSQVEGGDWVDMSVAVADMVASGEVDYGVLMCWTGTGTAIAANKVAGVRAAQASDPWIAENARRWNDANVLTLSLKQMSPSDAVACVEAFLAVDSPDADEQGPIDKLKAL